MEAPAWGLAHGWHLLYVKTDARELRAGQASKEVNGSHYAWPCSLYPTSHPACPTTLGLPSESRSHSPVGQATPLLALTPPWQMGGVGGAFLGRAPLL